MQPETICQQAHATKNLAFRRREFATNPGTLRPTATTKEEHLNDSVPQYRSHSRAHLALTVNATQYHNSTKPESIHFTSTVRPHCQLPTDV